MKVPVYDIVNCGPRHRFVANGKLVHNSGKLNLQNMGRSKRVDAKTKPGDLVMTAQGARQFEAFDGKLVVTRSGERFPANKCHRVGLRDTIIAPPGKRIVVVDSSNIELRVGHLLAGQMDTIEQIRAGVDLYSWFATGLYGYHVDKDTRPDERQHGKVAMLQLQYQSGAKAFRNAARVMGGIKISEAESERTVQVYRAQFPMIKKFWGRGQDAITDMIGGASNYIDQWGLCYTQHNRIVGPTGTHMSYMDLRYDQHPEFGDGYIYLDKEKRRVKRIYGGQIFENLCQWLARNIVFEQMLDIEKRYASPTNGVAMTAHDEVVTVVDEDDAEECLAWSLQRMAVPPTWWQPLPVAAEGSIGTVYGNCK